MPSYQHLKLVQRMKHLDTIPPTADEYASWIKAGGHLELLRENANGDELIVCASSRYTFVHTVVLHEDAISPVDYEDLLSWNGDAFSSSAYYTWGGGRDDVWIERQWDSWDSRTLDGSRRLVFGRTFEGLKENEAVYYEVSQEYSHLADIHWRPELQAYCRFDEHGEFKPAVLVTNGSGEENLTLVSFTREELEQYLAASGSVLVRMFDFQLLRYGDFNGWPNTPEDVVKESDSFFYRQKVDIGKAAYTRGVQIICPTRPKDIIFSSIKKDRFDGKDTGYCEFLADDWRNERVTEISTDPSATTNYFEASANSLPYELSPAFFRPEVLSKYKADPDKYTIDEERRLIDCRGGWEVRSFDINEAGQVHVYICDLRNLHLDEQRYWRAFNEAPKAPISRPAFINDFEGEATDITDPLVDILSILRDWTESDCDWWKLGEGTLLTEVHTPRSTSRHEWAIAFTSLSKVVVEGFQTQSIQEQLEERGIEFDEKDRSLVLIGRLLAHQNGLGKERKLPGLRKVQLIRSKVNSHRRGKQAEQLEKAALDEYGSYPSHFEVICRTVVAELKMIEEALS